MATAISSRLVWVRWLALPCVLAGVWAWAGGALGDNVPSLDELLTQGVENHPTVAVAKAKVALAEAELNQTRLDVSRQIIALRGEYDALTQACIRATSQLDATQQVRDMTKNQVAKGLADQKILLDAELKRTEAEFALMDAKARRANLGTELQRLLKAAALYPSQPQTPQAGGRIAPLPFAVVQKMAAALDTVIPTVEFEGPCLRDVVVHLRDVAKIPITVDAANGVSLENSVDLSLKLKDLTLSAVLQALEDLCPDTVFVVREYGLLLTNRSTAEEQGYIRACDLRKPEPGAETPKAGKESRPPAKDAPAQDRPAPTASPKSR